MHENIKDIFGKEWLKQHKIDGIDELMSSGIVTNVDTAFKIINNALDEIDKLIGKFKNIKEFDIWVKEALRAKNKDLWDILFELFCFDNLDLTTKNAILKPKNSEGRVVEALLKTSSKELYIEMHSIRELDVNINKRVRKLFAKAKIKFTDRDGVLFVDISKFNNIIDPDSLDLTLDPRVLKLAKKMEKRHNIGNKLSRLDSIVLVNVAWITNPITNEVKIYRNFFMLPNHNRKNSTPIPSLLKIFTHTKFCGLFQQILPKSETF